MAPPASASPTIRESRPGGGPGPPAPVPAGAEPGAERGQPAAHGRAEQCPD